MQAIWRIVATSFFAMLLAACTAASFKQPIAGFADATKAASTSVDAYSKTIDAAAQDEKIDEVIAKPSRIEIPHGDCRINSKGCRPMVRIGSVTTPLAPTPTTPKLKMLVAGLVTYSTNLTAIGNAETQSDLASAINATRAQTVGLAKAIDGLESQRSPHAGKLEPTVTAYASPIADAVTLGLGLALEQLKLAALREATGRMDEIFPVATRICAEYAVSGLNISKDGLFKSFEDANTVVVGPKVTAKQVEALQSAAAALDAALATDPKKVFADLRKAHSALTRALNDPQPSLDELWVALQQISDDAVKIEAISAALDKARKSTKT
ncbi:MAG TPA: hypothetical protein VGV41_12495 [Pseudolabrys sp.]|uniref:hypothetical protein n=1 Tax=Pseudolabrys sp. TaxID=1960880 RepID=UPI002DDD0718|nr:hypothetical protein [Pseudolabrys sp.]HEV2629450.1 hypothetical protein [Pseudolabrys sp.]